MILNPLPSINPLSLFYIHPLSLITFSWLSLIWSDGEMRGTFLLRARIPDELIPVNVNFWATPDFVITMASARRNALHGFQIHKDLPNFPIHQTIGALFDISTNTTSKILQRSLSPPPHCRSRLRPHPFLPQIASTTSSHWSLLRAPTADSNST